MAEPWCTGIYYGQRMSDGVEVLDIGQRPRSRRRPPRVVVRVLAGIAIGLVLLSLVALGALRSWDRRHTFSAAEAETALQSFDGSDLGRGSPSTADDLQAGDPHLTPAACSAVLTLGVQDALDGFSWYSTDDGTSGLPAQLLVGRYADPAGARRAHTALHAAVRTCDGVDARARNQLLGEGTTAVSYTTSADPDGLRDRLGLSTRWTLRVHQGAEDGIVLHLVARPYGNLLLVGLDQGADSVVAGTTSTQVFDRVAARLDQLASDH